MEGVGLGYSQGLGVARSWANRAGAQSGADRGRGRTRMLPYRNKCIENWEDICTLFGAGRAVGDGRSSSKDPTNSGSRKRKKGSVAEAVNSFAESFREYVQSKIKDTPRPTCQEIHTVVSQVFCISRSQIMRIVKRFMNGNPDEFLILKELPEDEKLKWVLLCLAE
ncbi:ER membrane protein complex subunit 2 [Bienertia sinuspersici]